MTNVWYVTVQKILEASDVVRGKHMLTKGPFHAELWPNNKSLGKVTTHTALC